MNTKEFFNNINSEIRNLHTPKALKIVEKRAKNYKDSIMREEIKSSIKKSVLREYKRTKKLIELQLKRIQ